MTINPLANDRNVDIATEREPAYAISGPDSNQDPDNAQFLGQLAPNEMSGDDTLRLGFEVHGVISESHDVDVYSFQGQAGTEVWLDIDRTSQSLDTVVELVDADGNIIALSDNSYSEEIGEQSLFSDGSKIDEDTVNPLRKSATDFYPGKRAGRAQGSLVHEHPRRGHACGVAGLAGNDQHVLRAGPQQQRQARSVCRTICSTRPS